MFLMAFETDMPTVGAEAAPLRFESKSGVLCVARDEATQRLVLDFPAEPPAKAHGELPAGTWEALGVDPARAVAVHDGSYWTVHLQQAADVRGAAPNMAALARVCPKPIMVTSRPDPAVDGPDTDFISRLFAPAWCFSLKNKKKKSRRRKEEEKKREEKG